MTADPYLFGGSPRQVRRIQRRFVAVFEGADRVLDIGCGRGIFLQLLAEAGVTAVGIDTHLPAVDSCRAQGFETYNEDAHDYLRSHADSFDGIFCSHVLEHLSFAAGVELIALCAQALHPGGRLVVVTPNPRDLGVIGETFWLDPTHVRPYPGKLVASMMQDQGLTVTRSGEFHGGVPRRELLAYAVTRVRLAPYYGRPNTYVIASKALAG